jgi:histidyl-tRNA synthetase
LRLSRNVSKWLATANLDLDVTLARGLNYYTELYLKLALLKVLLWDPGGGRYDDLTGTFI